MKRKNLCWIIAIVVGLWFCTSCLTTTTQVQPEKRFYPAETELYPAIYGAIAATFPNASFTQIDFYNNRYTISGITGETKNPSGEFGIGALETWYIGYDLNITLLPSGEIVPSYDNIYVFKLDSTGQNVSTSQRMNNFGKYDYAKDVNRITALMLEIANDSSLFEKSKKLAMNDIRFVYTIVKKFSTVAFNDFINNYAKGSVFNVKGTVYEIGEANRQINGKLYKYVITIVRGVASDRMSSGFYPQPLTDYIYCRYYTNDNTVIKLNKSDSCTINGILVGAEQGKSEITLYLDLIDRN